MRFVFCFASFSIVFAFGVLSYLYWDYTGLEKEAVVSSRSTNAAASKGLVVGVIGDSWVSGHKLDLYLVDSMRSLGLSARVVSNGTPGAKTRSIYAKLFTGRERLMPANRPVLDGSVKLCVVISGVNDSAGYVGADVYAYHLDLIVRALIARGITPLVVELPEYGIEEISSKTLPGTVKRWLLRAVQDQGDLNVIQKYRSAARAKLHQYIATGRIIYFPFAPVVADYHSAKDAFYADPSHLNDRGRQRLTRALAETIVRWAKSPRPLDTAFQASSF